MKNIDLNKAMFHADYGSLRTSDFVKFSDREKERAATILETLDGLSIAAARFLLEKCIVAVMHAPFHP